MKRQLIDRVETFDSQVRGNCKCGQPVVKVINSNITARVDKVRFTYPDDNSPACIFRCKKCLEVIEESFIPTP